MMKPIIFVCMMRSVKEQFLFLFSVPFYVVLIGFEILLSDYRKQNTYSLKDMLQCIYFMILNGGLDLLLRVAYVSGVLLFFYNHRLIAPAASPWVYWFVLLFFEDFMYYWLHRVDHQCRLFLAMHFTHHSSPKFNLTVGFRSSVLEPVYRFVYFIPAAWMGFHPLDILFIYSITQIWGILVHTEKVNKSGWLEYVLVTPSHHRVHHGANPKYIDRNMGVFLIVWDKLFGAFQKELPPDKIRAHYPPPLKKKMHSILFFMNGSIWLKT